MKQAFKIYSITKLRHMYKEFFSLAIFLSMNVFSSAQLQVKDSSLFDPHISISYAYQIPAGDLAHRFGDNHNIGFGFHIKSKTNWYYGVQGTYLTGNRVFQEKNFLSNLLVEGGYILDKQGQLAKISLQERGFTATLDGGYLFPVLGPNKNSGILAFGGIGILQHKIRIEHQEHEIPQLEGNYLKGYDRLTNGVVFHQFIGYYFMSSYKLINFYIGFEAWQGQTQSRRDFNLDTQIRDDTKRLDMLTGIRAGWTLHLYKRISTDFYTH